MRVDNFTQHKIKSRDEEELGLFIVRVPEDPYPFDVGT